MKHGSRKGYEAGCRCEACKGAKRENDRARRERLKRAVKEGDPSLRHGTATLYSKGGCRCAPCSDAYADTQRQWRADNPGSNATHVASYNERHPDARIGWKRRQDGAISHAPKSGLIWTGADLELIVTRRDLSTTQLARMLGRSWTAVADARYRATTDPKWIKVVGVSGESVTDD